MQWLLDACKAGEMPLEGRIHHASGQKTIVRLCMLGRAAHEASSQPDTSSLGGTQPDACLEGAFDVQDVAEKLPGILQRVRLVWSLSRFYNTPDRILSLLRKIGQEVTARCAAQISLVSLFNGDAIPVQAVLHQVSTPLAVHSAWPC